MSAYIKPGIQIVRIADASKDENNNVNLSLEQGEEVDALQALMGEGSFGGVDTANVRIFALTNESYKNVVTGFRLVEHINEYRSFFEQILLAYFPKNEVKFTTMYDGLKVSSIEDVKKFSASDVATVGNNITNYFVEKMKLADKSKEVRVKLYRQSESKTFVTLTPSMGTGYIGKKDDDTKMRNTFVVPFIEDAVIPEAASKVKFSDYERGIKDGVRTSWDKSSAEPVKADTPPTDPSDLPF